MELEEVARDKLIVLDILLLEVSCIVGPEVLNCMYTSCNFRFCHDICGPHLFISGFMFGSQ